MIRADKAGGILAESLVVNDRLEAVVIGAGVNVRSAPRGVEGAAALGDAGDDPSKLLTAFLFCLKQRYRPSEEGFGDDVISAYRGVCVTLGRNVRAETLDGRTVEGIAADVDDHGNLLVDDMNSGRREAVAFGQIEHLSR
jgi:BirA family biotin operon repressor/biotin-[acetyl-CoA-carboxylase] ligase